MRAIRLLAVSSCSPTVAAPMLRVKLRSAAVDGGRMQSAEHPPQRGREARSRRRGGRGRESPGFHCLFVFRTVDLVLLGEDLLEVLLGHGGLVRVKDIDDLAKAAAAATRGEARPEQRASESGAASMGHHHASARFTHIAPRMLPRHLPRPAT